MTTPGDVRTDNDFIIGSNGRQLGPPLLPMVMTTRQQAYRTAAWLVVMAVTLPDEPEPSTFDEIKHAIEAT